MRVCLLSLMMLFVTACGRRDSFSSVGSKISANQADDWQAPAPLPELEDYSQTAPIGVPFDDYGEAPLAPMVDPRDAPMGAPLEDYPDLPDDTQPADPRPLGNILYNPPLQMTLNLTERIEVRIGQDELQTTGLIGRGEVIRDEIPVSEFMTVRLCCGEPAEDYPFDIAALSSEQQIVDASGYTQWSFDVTPRKSGRQYLTLIVSAHYTFANGDIRTKDTPVKTDTIMITVDPAQEFKNWIFRNWPWLGLVVFSPFLSWCAFAAFRGRSNFRKSGCAVFVSYRREDSSGYTLAICEYLKKSLGEKNIFMDLEDIPHGEDFVLHLRQVLVKSNVVLVMIGEKWLDATNDKGRRLDDPEDFVRLEISFALQNNIRVLPVLLRNAQMPPKDKLPPDLQALSTRNAIRIHDDQFEASMEQLIGDITS